MILKVTKDGKWSSSFVDLKNIFADVFHTRNPIDWNDLQNQFDRFAEIYNAPGSTKSADVVKEELSGIFPDLDERIVNFAKTVENGKLTWEEFKYSLNAGAKVLKTVGAAFGNAILGFAITKVIEIAADKIDFLIHRTERLAEAAQDASNDIDELNSKFADAKKLASDSGKRFAELAQGVEVMTGKNLSLSDDEYAEFLSISQQLADTFPTLSRVYGENGEAIVQLSGDVDTIVGSLNDLVEVQRRAVNGEIIQKLPDVFAGAKAVAKDELGEVESLGKYLTSLEDTKQSIINLGSFALDKNKRLTITNADYDTANQIASVYSEAFNKAFDSLGMTKWFDPGFAFEGEDGLFKSVFDFSDLDNDQIQNVQNAISSQLSDLAAQYDIDIKSTEAKINVSNQKLDSAYSSLSNSLITYFNSTNGDYQLLSDQMKGLVQKTIGELDWGTIIKQSDMQTYDDAVAWLETKLIDSLQEIPDLDTTLSVALETQTKFNNNEVDVATYKAEVQKVLDLLDGISNEETKKAITLALGVTVDDEGNIETKADQLKNRIKSLFPDVDDTEIDNFVNSLTLDQIDPKKFGRIAGGLDDVTVAFERYLKAVTASSKANPAVTYDEAVTKLQEYTDKFKALNTVYQKFADQDATTPIELADIDALNKAFADVENIKQYTRELYEVQAAGGDLQPIFDKICSAFINQSDLIDLVNDDTRGLIETWLDEQGVLNTDTFLILDLIKSHADAAWSARDLTEATQGEIFALAHEAESSDEARRAFEIYIAQKLLSNAAIDPSADITALANIVSSLGIATGAWQKYYAAKREMEALESSTKFNAIYYENGVQKTKQWQSYTTVDEQGNTVEHLFTPERYDKEKKSVALRAELFSKQYAQELEDMAKDIKFKYPGPPTTSKKTGDGSGGGSGSDREEEKETFDWIERKAEIEQRLHDNLQKTLDDESASYREQISALKEMTALDDKRVASATAAAEHYAAAWNEAIQGIDQEHLDYIMNGGDIVELEVPRDVADQLEKAKDIYDKMVESQIQEVDLIKEANDHRKASFDLETEIIKKQQEKLQNEMDLLQARLDLAEAEGHALSTGAYEEQISMSEDMVDLYRDQKEALYDRLAEEEEGSAAYAEYLSAIYDCESAIIDCEKQQAEWNDAIRRLPIDRLEEYVTLIGDAKTDLQNYIDIQTASGKQIGIDQYQTMFDISKTQLDKMLEQRAAMQDLLGSYDYGSGKFNDLSSEIQSLDNSISSLIQEMFGFNDAILKIPIDKMSQLNDEMSLYSDTLGDVLSDYDSALSAVNTLLDDQIESLNDLKEQAEKTYQEQIDPLQEQLDLLSKTNDQRERQLALEQAKYALERAQNQKTSQVKYIA